MVTYFPGHSPKELSTPKPKPKSPTEELIADLQTNRDALVKEVERLKRGDFTPEEIASLELYTLIHTLTHQLPKEVAIDRCRSLLYQLENNTK